MFNLIRKDLIIQKYQLIAFIPLIIIFAMYAQDFSPIFIFVFASVFIPLNAYIYDSLAESHILLNSLPYTRKEIVAARYLGCIAYMIVTTAIVALILYFFDFEYEASDIAIAAGSTLVLTALAFPLFYIIKPEYVATVAFIGGAMIVVIYQPVIDFLTENLTSMINFITDLSTSTLYLSSGGIAIGLYLISWVVSQLIYTNKEF